MKLYATTTSERASKGQGGNKRLDIEVTAGKERKTVFKLNTYSKDNSIDDEYCISIMSVEGNIVFMRALKAAIREAEEKYIKGEKKKGDTFIETLERHKRNELADGIL